MMETLATDLVSGGAWLRFLLAHGLLLLAPPTIAYFTIRHFQRTGWWMFWFGSRRIW